MRATKVLIFFIFLCTTGVLKAQTNFVKGYYITNVGDTVSGYIEYRSVNRNHKFFVFKKDLEDDATTIYPKSIAGYVIEDTNFYETHSFKTKKGEDLYGFFKVAVKGKLSLLSFNSRYFAKNQEGEIFEISKRNELTENNKMREDFYGLGVLKVLMKDCDDMAGKMLEKEYKSTDNFANIFKRYNQCVGSSTSEPQKIVIKPHADFGLQVSPTISTLNLNASLSDASFEKNLSFSTGGFASIFIPKVNENLRLLAETTYAQDKYYAYFISDNTHNDLFVELSYLKMPVFFRYGIHRVFVDLGIQNQFILNQDSKWRVETVLQNTVLTNNKEIVPFNTWSFGYVAGLGLKYELYNYNIRSSLRFSQSKMSSHPNQPVFRSIELNLSIQLTK